MAKALFMGLSMAFFLAYALLANALLIDTEYITPVQINSIDSGEECENQIPGPGRESCGRFALYDIPLLGPLFEATDNAIQTGFSLFAPFFQLITFQANGLEAASFITILIFGPLTFINAFIVFSAIRGSS